MQLNALDRSIIIAAKKLLSGEIFIFSVIAKRTCVLIPLQKYLFT